MKNIIAIFTMFIVIGLVSLNIGTAGTTSHEGHGQTHTPAPTQWNTPARQILLNIKRLSIISGLNFRS